MTADSALLVFKPKYYIIIVFLHLAFIIKLDINIMISISCWKYIL